MKILSHYGDRVIMQQTRGITYKEILGKLGIRYHELPLQEDVLVYNDYGTKKYVYISPLQKENGILENVFTLDRIPDDMDWERLENDCIGQLEGKPPCKMQTKAHWLVMQALQTAAEEAAREKVDEASAEWWIFPSPVTPAAFQKALAGLGYSASDISKMDHYDIGETFLNEMLNI